MISLFIFGVVFLLIFTPTKTQHRKYLTCDLWDKSVHKENLTDIIWPDILESNTDSVVVDYGNCGIKVISEIPKYSQIIYLSLERNKIQNLKRETFYNIENLEVLKLNNNNLTSLTNGVFTNLLKVQHLYLQNNRIKKIGSEVFKGMYALTTLHLEQNRITTLANNIFSSNIKLEYLNIKDNPINYDVMTIDKFTTKLPKLKSSFLLRDNISPLIRQPAGNTPETSTVSVTNISDTIDINKEVTMNPISHNDMTVIYTSGSLCLLLMTIFLTIIIIKCRRRNKSSELLEYDLVRNPSVRSETSAAYIEANCSSDKILNAKFGARKFSYLEPRVFTIKVAPPFQRNTSYLSVY